MSSSQTSSLLLLAACLATLFPTSSALVSGFKMGPSKPSNSSAAIGDGAPGTPPSKLSAASPPADFSIGVITGGSIPIGKKDCFQITIDALNSLVKVPSDSFIPASEYFRSRFVPGVALYFSGNVAAGGFDVRYMIWGLNRAMAYAVEREKFADWRFTLRWRNKFVGYLWYLYQSPRGALDANKTSSLYNPMPTGRDVATFGNGDQNAVFEFRIFDLPGEKLDFDDIMMVIIGALTDIAANDMAVQVHGNSFSTELAPYRGKFELVAAAPPSYPLIWFTYDVVRQALGTTAAWYLVAETYKPVGIAMLRHRVYFGRGSLQIKDAKLVEVGGAEGRERNSTSS